MKASQIDASIGWNKTLGVPKVLVLPIGVDMTGRVVEIYCRRIRFANLYTVQVFHVSVHRSLSSDKVLGVACDRDEGEKCNSHEFVDEVQVHVVEYI